MDKLTLEEIQGIKERSQKTNTGHFENGVTLYECVVCQKKFPITDMAQWVYKRKTRMAKAKNQAVLYLCSYACIRKFDSAFEK